MQGNQKDSKIIQNLYAIVFTIQKKLKVLEKLGLDMEKNLILQKKNFIRLPQIIILLKIVLIKEKKII